MGVIPFVDSEEISHCWNYLALSRKVTKVFYKMPCNSAFCAMLIRYVSYPYMERLDYLNMAKLNSLCAYFFWSVRVIRYLVSLYQYVGWGGGEILSSCGVII